MARALIILLLCIAPFVQSLSSLTKQKYLRGFVPPPKIHPSRLLTLPQPLWFDQKLDHFNNQDTRTWKQKYFVNDTFFDGTGPIFLMIGGEGPADAIWSVEGQWINYGQQMKALCIQLEHRFYGDSHPTMDLSVDNLRYLSSEQALFDLAYFIQSYKDMKKLTGPWITFGGSYPGSLSAWFRLKYPHLAVAAVSSSAPLLAKVDFLEYLEVVTQSLTAVSTSCIASIGEAFDQVLDLVQTPDGQKTLQKTFQLCGPLQSALDINTLLSNLAGLFEGIVQYSGDNRAFEGAKDSNVTMVTLCTIMNDDIIGDNLARLAAVNSLLMNVYGQSCQDSSYNDTIAELRDTTWGDNAAARAWTYQTCTEYGWYQSSDSSSQPFGNLFPLSYWVNQCADIFGPQFDANFVANAVRSTNDFYGDLSYAGNNVIFVNGAVDPWHAMGYYMQSQTPNPVVYIEGGAHCSNMYPDSPNDPVTVRNARKIIFMFLQKVLARL